MKELVSIITPNYNCKKYIASTIESVICQTYPYWEMIIVDDCSNDGSVEIIEKYIIKDNRIKLIKFKNNFGPAIARNTAIKEAKGRYIAFLDSDDLWYPEKLEKQIKYMNDKKCALSYSYYDVIDENNNRTNQIYKPKDKLSYCDLLKTCSIGCLTSIYDTKIVRKEYMPIIKKRQDYGLWLKILKKIDYAYCIKEVLATYRIRKGSISSNKLELIKYNWKLFREHEKLSIIKSFYYLNWNIIIKSIKIIKR